MEGDRATPSRAEVAQAPAPRAQRGSRRRRLFAGAGSVVAHAAILSAFLLARADAPKVVTEPPLMTVQLADARPAQDVAAAVAAPTPEPPKPKPQPPPPPRVVSRRVLTHRAPDARPEDAAPSGEGAAELSDAQLAGAATAGAGGAGRACDMTRRLQAALRRDARVQAAVAVADRAAGGGGKAHLLWDGDWIRSRGQEGEGLAAVREAIMWEVAFAPEACRAEPVHGLVLFSMADGPGSGRLVVGQGQWRWSDLLRPRGGG